MKTTEEWFETLNEKYREKALKNMTSPKAKHQSLLGAISNGFDWNKSFEGSDFWMQAFREVRSGVYAPVETNEEMDLEVVPETENTKSESQKSKKETIIIEPSQTFANNQGVDAQIKNKSSLSDKNVYNSLEEMNFSTKK